MENRRPAGTRLWRRVLALALLPIVTTSSCSSPSSSSRRGSSVASALEGQPTPPKPMDPTDDPTAPGPSMGSLSGGGSVSDTGAYTYGVTLDVPPGLLGVQPRLGLSYSSGGGNGIVGEGWTLSASSVIRRCGRTIWSHGVTDGVSMTARDRFCLDGAVLAAITGTYGADGTEYRTEADGIARVVSHGQHASGAPLRFEVYLKSGLIRRYEAAPAVPSRATEQGLVAEAAVVPAWLLVSETDRAGNRVRYEYRTSLPAAAPFEHEFLLERIRYTDSGIAPGLRSVELEYEPRPDATFSYEAGVRWGSTQRVKAVKMYAPLLQAGGGASAPALAWQFLLAYEREQVTGRSRLSSVQKCGHEGTCTWKRQFTWEGTRLPAFSASEPFDLQGLPNDGYRQGPRVFDADGDGRDDVLIGYRTGEWATDLCAPPYRFFDQSEYRQLLARPDTATAGGLRFETHAIRGHFDANNAWVPAPELTEGLPHDPEGDGTYVLHHLERAHELHCATASPPRDVVLDPGDNRTYRWNGTGYTAGPQGAIPPGNQATQPGPVRRALGDMDGDGLIDVVHSGYEDYEVTDVAGDGRADLVHLWQEPGGAPYRAVSSKDTAGAWVHAPDPLCPEAELDCRRADFNGDGLDDVYWIDRDTSQVFMRWNLGGRPSETTEIATLSEHMLVPPVDREVAAADLNGDGCVDLLWPNRYEPAPGTLGTQWYAMVSKCDGDFAAAYLYGLTGPVMPRTGDFNGDGVVDLVTSDRVFLGNPSVNAIVRVRDEGVAEPRAEIAYRRTSPDDAGTGCVFPQVCVKRGMQVVDRVAGLEAPGGRWYRYFDPRRDVHGGGFLGFGETRIWDPTAPSELITTRDLSVAPTTKGVYLGDVTTTSVTPLLEAGLAGPATQPATATARVIRSHATRGVHALHGGKTYFVTSPVATQTIWEQAVQIQWAPGAARHVSGVAATPPSTARASTTTTRVDEYNNPTLVRVAVKDGDTHVQQLAYEYRPADWLIALRVDERSALTGPGPFTTAPRHTTHQYDPRGRLVATHLEPTAGDASQRATQTWTYDNAGRVIAEQMTAPGAEPRQNVYSYTASECDPSGEGIFPCMSWRDPDGVPGNGDELAVFVVREPAYGNVVVTQDGNGVRTFHTYDDLGRPIAQRGDGTIELRTTPSVRLDGQGQIIGTRTTTTSADPSLAHQSVIDLDLHNREIRHQATGFEGAAVVATSVYDIKGRAVQVQRPAIGAPGAGAGKTVYDSLGRPLRHIEPDGAVTRRQYGLGWMEIVDAAGQRRKFYENAAGQLAISESYLGAQALQTRYEYAPGGHPRTIRDPEGNETAVTYDLRGRRASISRPGVGASTTRYNGLNDVVETDEPGPGGVTAYTYDRVGRLTSILDADGLTSHIWDTAPHGAGKLARSIGSDGIETRYAYDDHGRPIRRTWEVAGEALAIDVAYDGLGRVREVQYPEVPGRDRLTARFGHDGFGALREIFEVLPSGAPMLRWSVVERDADGSLIRGLFGNGVQVDHTYEPLTGALERTTLSAGGNAFYAQAFAYDPMGRVERRWDPTSTRSERFWRDSLGRLTRWKLEDGSHERDTGYTYDALGNVREVAASVDQGPAVTESLFTFGAAAHLPTHHNGGALTYDARGRLTTDAGAGRTIAYAERDLPRTITTAAGTTSFVYDAEGARVIKDGPSGRTLTLAGLYERRTSPSGDHAHTFRIGGTDGASIEVVYHETTGKVARRYVHADLLLGNVSVVTDDDGQEIQRQYYEPFGQRTDARGAPGAAGVTSHGFTGHEHDDELGLINMRGRIYDPRLRRFLTQDPLISAPLDGQGLNPYAYVRNAPLDATDPSGWQEKGRRWHDETTQVIWDLDEQGNVTGEATHEILVQGIAPQEEEALQASVHAQVSEPPPISCEGVPTTTTSPFELGVAGSNRPEEAAGSTEWGAKELFRAFKEESIIPALAYRTPFRDAVNGHLEQVRAGDDARMKAARATYRDMNTALEIGQFVLAGMGFVKAATGVVRLTTKLSQATASNATSALSRAAMTGKPADSAAVRATLARFTQDLKDGGSCDVNAIAMAAALGYPGRLGKGSSGVQNLAELFPKGSLTGGHYAFVIEEHALVVDRTLVANIEQIIGKSHALRAEIGANAVFTKAQHKAIIEKWVSPVVRGWTEQVGSWDDLPW